MGYLSCFFARKIDSDAGFVFRILVTTIQNFHLLMTVALLPLNDVPAPTPAVAVLRCATVAHITK